MTTLDILAALFLGVALCLIILVLNWAFDRHDPQ